MLRKHHNLLLPIVLLSMVLWACNKKTSLIGPDVRYQYSQEEIPSDWYASAKEMKATWEEWNKSEISENEWLKQLDQFLESKAKGLQPSECFLKEYLIFPTLDKVLLPKYKSTGALEYQEALLKYLVDLDRCESSAELKLQTESLLAISSGGYQYPGLNERLIMRLNDQKKRKNSSLSDAEISSLLSALKAL